MIDDDVPMTNGNKPAPTLSTSATPLTKFRVDETSRELCMRFLLGEVSVSESDEVLKRIQSEPAFADELAAQSDLICQIVSMPTVATHHSSFSADRGTLARNGWWIIAAIAASLSLTAVLWSNVGDDTNPVAIRGEAVSESPETDEELLVAMGWADGPLSLALNTDSESVDASTTIIPESDASRGSLFGVADQETLEPSDDSVVQWMIAGVMAGADLDG